MFCIKCGKEIEDGSTFCEFCGAKQLTSPVQTTEEPSERAVSPNAGFAPGPLGNSSGYSAHEGYGQPMPSAPPRRSGGGKIALIVIAAVLVIGGLVGGGCLVVHQQREQQAALQAAQEEMEAAQAAAAQAAAEQQKAQEEAEKAQEEAAQALVDAERAKQQAALAEQQAALAEQQAQAAEDDPLEHWQQDTANAMKSYVYSLNDAINARDFSIVAPVFVYNSSIYKDQKQLVSSLGEQGITENVVSVSMKSQSLRTQTTATVVSDEVIGVTYADGSYKEIAQSYAYHMELQSNGVWLLYKMTDP